MHSVFVERPPIRVALAMAYLGLLFSAVVYVGNLGDEPLASLLRPSDRVEAADEPSDKNLEFLAAANWS
jgi:hypothetical protein